MNGKNHFHCDPNFHFTRFTKSQAVPVLYSLGYRLTRRKDGEESGKFYASAQNIANQYGYNEKTVDRALKFLVKQGFFVLIFSGKATREPSVYQVLSHSEWASLHPGMCCTKDEFCKTEIPVTYEEVGA